MKKMKSTNTKRFLSILLIASAFTACEKSEQITNSFESPNHSNAENEEINKLKHFLARSFNVEENEVSYSNELFSIDGDMFTSLEDTRIRYNTQPATRQRRSTYVVNASIAPNIKVFVSSDVASNWLTPIDQAIAAWNATDCLIKFSKTTDASLANVTIRPYAGLASNVQADAGLPTPSGNPGGLIRINPAMDDNAVLSDQAKIRTIAHELGHTVGFHHTGQLDKGTLIEGTIENDPSSTMYAYNPGTWNGFSPYDIIAFGIVYPNFPGTTRLLRYYNSNTGDYFYTTDHTELGAGRWGYTFENVAKSSAYIFTTQQSGTIPLYRFFNGTWHYYSVSQSNPPAGFSFETIAGYIKVNKTTGTSSLYRYYNPSRGYFMTKNWSELGAGKNGYAYIGYQGGYVY